MQSSFCPSVLVSSNSFFLSHVFSHLLPLLRMLFIILSLSLFDTYFYFSYHYILTRRKTVTVLCDVNEFCSTRWKKARWGGGGTNAAVDVDLCHNDGSIVDNNCFRLVSEKRLRFALIFCSLVNLIK